MTGIVLCIYGASILPQPELAGPSYSTGANIQWNSTLSATQDVDPTNARIQSPGFVYAMVGAGLVVVSLVFIYICNKNTEARILPVTQYRPRHQVLIRTPPVIKLSRPAPAPDLKPSRPAPELSRPAAEPPRAEDAQPTNSGIMMHYLQPMPIKALIKTTVPNYYPPAYRKYYIQRQNI